MRRGFATQAGRRISAFRTAAEAYLGARERRASPDFLALS